MIITLGKDGAILGGRDGIHHVPAFAMKAVDTTGAGDVFIGCLATFLSQGVDQLAAIRRESLRRPFHPEARDSKVIPHPRSIRPAVERQWLGTASLGSGAGLESCAGLVRRAGAESLRRSREPCRLRESSSVLAASWAPLPNRSRHCR